MSHKTTDRIKSLLGTIAKSEHAQDKETQQQQLACLILGMPEDTSLEDFAKNLQTNYVLSLGLSADASLEEISDAEKNLALTFHHNFLT